MTITPSNKSVSTALWSALWARYYAERTAQSLVPIIEMYLEQYPRKQHAIQCTCIAFSALVGVVAEDENEYHQLIDEFIPPI
jgi:hypothetical protein